MKVSIILLAHNEEKNIAYEIDSIKDKILNKLNEYEFIISEDGSTDKTREIILKKKKEVDLIYFTSEVRRGSKNAMLESFKIATGDYIFIADSGRNLISQIFGNYIIILKEMILSQDCVQIERIKYIELF